jgi:hypothetical protein
MSKFRGSVQVYRSFIVEAPTQDEAEKLIEAMFRENFPNDLAHYTVNHPLDLDKKKGKKNE